MSGRAECVILTPYQTGTGSKGNDMARIVLEALTVADIIFDEMHAEPVADERTMALRAAQSARRAAERAARAAAPVSIPVGWSTDSASIDAVERLDRTLAQ